MSGVGRSADAVIDFHVHPLTRVMGVERLVRDVVEAGVETAVLLALDLDPSYLDDREKGTRFLESCINAGVGFSARILEEVRYILDAGRVSNEEVARIVRENPGLFVGVGSVNPNRGVDDVRRMLRDIDRLGLVGVKLIPTLQFFNPLKEKRKMEIILEFCEKNDKIVIFHTGCDPLVWESPELSKNSHPKLLEPYIRGFRNVSFILAHMGSYSARFPGIWFRDAVELGKRYDNVWFDVSAVPYILTMREFADVVSREIGWSRVLFGSDYPVFAGESIKSILDYVRSAAVISESDLWRVLHDNASRLLGL